MKCCRYLFSCARKSSIGSSLLLRDQRGNLEGRKVLVIVLGAVLELALLGSCLVINAVAINFFRRPSLSSLRGVGYLCLFTGSAILMGVYSCKLLRRISHTFFKLLNNKAWNAWNASNEIKPAMMDGLKNKTLLEIAHVGNDDVSYLTKANCHLILAKRTLDEGRDKSQQLKGILERLLPKGFSDEIINITLTYVGNEFFRDRVSLYLLRQMGCISRWQRSHREYSQRDDECAVINKLWEECVSDAHQYDDIEDLCSIIDLIMDKELRMSIFEKIYNFHRGKQQINKMLDLIKFKFKFIGNEIIEKYLPSIFNEYSARLNKQDKEKVVEILEHYFCLKSPNYPYHSRFHLQQYQYEHKKYIQFIDHYAKTRESGDLEKAFNKLLSDNFLMLLEELEAQVVITPDPAA